MKPHSSPDPTKETILLYEVSPELEKELVRRARESGGDPSTEAAKVIERHVEEAGTDVT